MLGGTSGTTGLTGALNVLGGGNLTTAQIVLGYGGLGTGTATIDGTGSIVTIVRGTSPFSGLDIGSWGTGSMSVTGGARVVCSVTDCQFSDIGGAAGSNGTLTINGPGSSVTGLGSLNVGQANVAPGYGTPGGTTTGTLFVQNGGVLGTIGGSTVSAGAFGTQANGSEHTVGNVTIDGAGSRWSVTEDPISPQQARINMAATPNATATVNVINGGQMIVTGGTFTSYIGVGDGGAATLNILNGGQVSAADMVLGSQTTGVGTVTVGGTSSALTIGNGLTVGNQSTGANALTVNSGGTVTVNGNNNGSLSIAQGPNSKGTVTVNTGGTVNVTGTGGLGIAGSQGSQGTVLVDGGQLNVNGANSFFGVGNSGTGTLTIRNGGQVSAVNLGLGNQTTGVGTVTVGNGTGSSVLTVTNSMGVGNQSTATSTLTVNAGGTVALTNNAGLGIANSQGSKGTVSVDGGQLTTGPNGGITVGSAGIGTLTVQNGGQVSVGGMTIGNQTTGSGTVSVGNGSGSSLLTVTGGVTIGQQSSGPNALNINTGGTVTLTGANPGGLAIAQATGTQGAVTVDGGTLNLNGTNSGIGVGNGGTGTLTIQNGGQVTLNGANGGVNVSGVSGSSGNVLVNGGQLRLLGANSFFGVGNGDASGSSATGTLTIQNGGTVSAVNLGLGNQTTGVGTVTVGNGTGSSVLTVTNSMGVGNSSTALSQLTVNSGGIVNVTGTSGLGIAGAVGSQGKVLVDGGQLNLSGAYSSLGVGNSGTGALTIQNGGALTASSLTVASQANSTGVVNIIGTGVIGNPQTVVNLIGPANSTNGTNALQVGNWGNGTMTVSNGAIINSNIVAGMPNANCASTFCANYVGNGAGSTALLTLTGAGTTANLVGAFTVGGGAVFTNPPNNFTFGTPGGTTNATVQVLAGASLNTYQSTVSTGPGGNQPTGNEHTIANVIVNGANSVWNIAQSSNSQATLNLATQANATATIDVTNGGRLAITGGQVSNATILPGIGMGAGTSTINVKTGGVLVIDGYTGFITVGTNGGTALLDIASGGQVRGDGPNGLAFMNIGRTNGSHGTVNVDGSTSSLTLSGVGGAGTGSGSQDQGAFMNIGRESGSVGTVNVTNGGSILIRDNGQNATVGGPGMNIGRDAGAEGHLVVSGAGSSLTIRSTGALSLNPEISVGRNGTGTMLVEGGATVAVDAGDPATRSRNFSVGRNPGSNGTLTVTSGSEISASVFLIGNNGTGAGPVGGTGTATFNNATARITGVDINQSGTAGGIIAVGRGIGSVGTLNLENGARVIVDTPFINPSIFLGGTGLALGGNGTLNMSGGSSISFPGTGAAPRVVIGHSGTGLFTMTGGSTLSMPNDGSIVLGARSSGNGTLQLGGGSTIDTGILYVGNNGQGQVTMTGGALGVHGAPSPGIDEVFVVGAFNGAVGMFSQSGGTVSAASGLVLAWQTGSSGTYTLSGGALTTGGLTVGDRGTGVFVNNASTNNVSGDLIVAGDTTSNGSSYTITGNSAHTSVSFLPGANNIPTDPPGLNGIDPITNQPRPVPNGALAVGVGGTGTFTQGAANFSDPGNTVNVAGDLVVGVFGAPQGGAGQGTYTLNTGTLTVGGKMVVGAVSQGANVFTQNGGSVAVTGAASGNPDYVGLGGNDSAGQLIVGGGINDVGGGTGTYVLRGGTVTASLVQVGLSGTGTFNQSGGTVNTPTLLLGNCGGCNGGNASGTYNLSGNGVLTAGSVTVGGFGHGVFTQSGTSTATVAGNMTVGSGPEQPAGPANNPVREGIVSVSGGTLSVGGNMIVGAGNAGTVGGFPGEPGGKGGFTQTGGSVTISGGLTIGQGSGTGASAGGTGEYVLRGGTLTVTGQTIVGGGGADSSLGGIGTLFVLDGATMHAGTLLGIGSDGNGSNGAKGTVILDGGANVFATNIKIGAGGCLGGNGTVHGSVVMAGVTIGDCNTGVTPTITMLGNGPGTGVGIEGFLKPGRSPGTLVIDGSFQFISGTIVLDVQADPNAPGGFLTDQLIFAAGTIPDLKQAKIEYMFLGDTDPNAFANAPNDPWNLDTFFKTIDTTGGTPIVKGISALGPLGEQFSNNPDNYTANADAYMIEQFVFTPTLGVVTVDAVPIPPESTVPEPSTIWLLLLGSLLLLRSAGMRHLAARTRRM